MKSLFWNVWISWIFKMKRLNFSMDLRQDITSKWKCFENIFSACRFEVFFKACFFDNNFLEIIAVSIYLLLWIFWRLPLWKWLCGWYDEINCFYWLNLYFLQWKWFSTYNCAAPSGAPACRPSSMTRKSFFLDFRRGRI